MLSGLMKQGIDCLIINILLSIVVIDLDVKGCRPLSKKGIWVPYNWGVNHFQTRSLAAS